MDITLDFMAETKQTTYNEITGKGKLRHLYIRYGEMTDELMVCYVVNGNGLKSEDLLVEKLKAKLPNLKSVVVNSNREKTNVILGNKISVSSKYLKPNITSNVGINPIPKILFIVVA